MCSNIQNVFVTLSDRSQLNNDFSSCIKTTHEMHACQVATASIAPDKRSFYFDIVCTE